MWMLNFLPDSWLHAFVLLILSAGIILYALSLLANFIPPALPYRTPIRILGTILLIAGVYFYGSYDNEMKWRAEAAKLKADMDRKVALSEKNSKQVITKYVTKTKVIKEKGDAIKKLSKHVKEADAQCVVPKSFVLLHDSAAKNEVPDTSKGVDGTAAGINLSTVGETVTINYNNYHQLSERLKALQDWVSSQERIYNE